MHRCIWMLPWLAVVLVGLQRPAWAEPEEADEAARAERVPAQTRELFRAGLAAYNRGDAERARALFLEAWTLRPSADVAMQLAQTELDLRQYAEAATHLDYAIRYFTPSISDKLRTIAKAAHKQALPHVVRLNITVNEPGAEVFVNQQLIGKSPLEGLTYVDCTSCLVEARSAERAVSASVEAQLGEQFTITLNLPQPVPATPTSRATMSAPWATATRDEQKTTAAAAPEVRSAPAQEKSLVPMVVGGALTLAGVITGTGLLLASHSDSNRADELRADLAPEVCTGATAASPECLTLGDMVRRSDREHNGALIAFTIAGTAAIGSLVYWFWPRSDKRTVTQAQLLSPQVAPGLLGLTCQSAF